METISKNHLKQISRLTSKKFQQQSNLVIVEGLRTIKHLVDNDIPLMELYLGDEDFQHHFAASKIYQLKPDQFKRITSTKNPQNIAALVEKINLPLQDHKFVVYLDRINEPGNLGTIIRTAAAAGLSGVVVSPDSCSIYNSKAVRASLGSVFTLPVEIQDIEWVKSASADKIATSVDDATHLFNFSRPEGDIILVIGSEAHGIRPELLKLCNSSVKIPLHNSIESLNAAVAAGVAIYYLIQLNKL